jgi:hypothetical protein
MARDGAAESKKLEVVTGHMAQGQRRRASFGPRHQLMALRQPWAVVTAAIFHVGLRLHLDIPVGIPSAASLQEVYQIGLS